MEGAAADPAERKLALQPRHDKSDTANFNSISFGPVSKLITRCERGAPLCNTSEIYA